MSTRTRRLTTAAGLVTAFPLLVGFIGPGHDHDDEHGPAACEDDVAEAIHDLEQDTHLHALHIVEEAYCAVIELGD